MADLNFAGSYDGLHLPYSPEAEQAVLGAIILESDTFDKVVDTLKSPDYFYVSLHKLIFAQMQEMIGLGLSIDFVTLLEKLKQNKAFDESTGKPYLMDLILQLPVNFKCRGVCEDYCGKVQCSQTYYGVP